MGTQGDYFAHYVKLSKMINVGPSECLVGDNKISLPDSCGRNDDQCALIVHRVPDGVMIYSRLLGITEKMKGMLDGDNPDLPFFSHFYINQACLVSLYLEGTVSKEDIAQADWGTSPVILYVALESAFYRFEVGEDPSLLGAVLYDGRVNPIFCR